jgi:4-alpha-glucanotransferase
MLEDNLSTQLLNSALRDKWGRLGTQKRSGVLIPLFSAYSRDSLGIGELADLKFVIDWAKNTGNSIIQLLPMNEVGALFCPYDSISSFALEPAYLSLGVILKTKRKDVINRIENIRRTFPAGQGYVNYQIKKEKISLLWELFLEDNNYKTQEFEQFIDANKYWINDFALYKAIKDYQLAKPWYEWDGKYKNRDKSALNKFYQEHEKEVCFQIWMQWLTFQQFKEVRRYAQSKNILLKGDLPILVSRDSADVWTHPEFFKLEYASGAPPDMYAALGQRWGMPTNNWENISKDGYTYLKEKLRYAQEFYDILRIDHVVGLFRIWSIPYDEPLENKGLNGFFDPRDESRWKQQGKEILSVMLENTDMLLCAEDLGVIPKACTEALEELGIPGNDVQRWIKDWKVKHDFLEPQDYRKLSVAMLSTHDTTNWPAWWENEAGTIDEGLFMRKCADHRKIDYGAVKDKLFDFSLTGHGRLRWQDSVDSVDKLVAILNQGRIPEQGTVPKEHLADFIDLYENSYREKEKLWAHLKIKGPMRERCDVEIMRCALGISLDSRAIFCINTIIDWLYLIDIFKGDAYHYRTNTPGTVSNKNWSLVLPISLEDLLKHKVNKEIRSLIADSGRI